MPQGNEQPSSDSTSWITSAPQEIERLKERLNELIARSIEFNGFVSTLKHLKKGKFPQPVRMGTVRGGVVEYLDSGRVDAALETEHGRIVLRDAVRSEQDPQFLKSSGEWNANCKVPSPRAPLSQMALLSEIESLGLDAPSDLICRAEFTRFDSAQRFTLLPLLWNYILHHRNSNDTDVLIAVGSAIRKYAALVPMDRIADLATLLDATQRVPLSVDLELEVAKMIYRTFEVNPSLNADPDRALANRLWEMGQAYLNPRLLLRDKYSAVASLSLEALIAMRSHVAKAAWQAVLACPFAWFREMVDDDLIELRRRWTKRDEGAAAWLDQLREEVSQNLCGEKA